MGVSRNWEFPETSFKNPMQGRTGAPVCTARVSLLTSISSKFLYINHTVSLIFAIFQFEISSLINWIFSSLNWIVQTLTLQKACPGTLGGICVF